MTTWFISDTHFNHKNIIKYEPTRIDMLNMKTDTIEEMNQRIIEVWNEIVKPEDVVFHLGDVSFGKFDVSVLNGYKILIKGNHDYSDERMKRMGFQEVHQLKIVNYEGKSILLTHKPFMGDCENFPFNDFGDGGEIHLNIHGHLHSEPSPTNKHICVSMEQINCKPISLEEVVRNLK